MTLWLIPYPEITPFLTELHILQYADTFEEKDFYHIDELLKLDAATLRSTEFMLSAGNAQFLLDAIKAEVKQIDKLCGRRRVK